MNVQRRINWRRRWTVCQSFLAWWMDKSDGGATNVDPKAGGPTFITLQNMIQISLSTRKRMVSPADKSTLEKDWLCSEISGWLKSDCHQANQETISDNNCTNCSNSSGEDSTMSTHGSRNANVASINWNQLEPQLSGHKISTCVHH